MNLSSLLSNLNYGTILLLMLIESTVIPFPSEVVVAPAAYHAAAGYQNVFRGIVCHYRCRSRCYHKLCGCLLSRPTADL